MESEEWVETQVRRATFNSLIWNGISLSILLVLVWLLSDYYYWIFRGPLLVNDDQLLKIIDRDSHRSIIAYVEMKDRILRPTEWQEVMTRDGKPYSETPYFLMPVGERGSILVMAKDAADGKHLVGPLSGLREMDQRVIDKVVQKHPELRGKIIPIVLNHVAAFPVAGYILLVFLVPWGVYCGWNVSRAVVARISPSQHSIVRQLGRLGDPLSLAATINEEVKRDSVRSLGKAILTDSWILRPTVFGANCVRLADVVWAYALHRSTENFAVLHRRDGRTSAIFLSKDQATELIAALRDRAKWIILGYDADRMKKWSKSRDEIIQQSDRLRVDG